MRRRTSLAARVLGFFGRKPTGQRSPWKGAEISRLWFDWIASPISADQEIYNDFLRLRARARELSRNSPLIRHYLAQLEANVIGADGFKFQPVVRNNDGKLNKLLNEKIADAFKDWSEDVTVDHEHSLVDLQMLLIKNLATDGEVCVRKIGAFNGNAFGFALQHIDPDLLDHMYFRVRDAGGNEVRMGVEVDLWGAPVAYYFWDRHPTDLFNVSARNRLRIPANEILHIYLRDRANQTRGITWFNSIMFPLKMLDGYMEAELVAARTGAAKMGFFQWKTPEDFEPPQAGEKLEINADPGKFEQLPPGLEFKEWNPSHPSTAFQNFLKSMIRVIASGLRMAYNTLANDLEGVNYSSMRSGVLVERDQWRKIQKFWARKFLMPIYRDWLAYAELSGQLQLDARPRAAFQAVRFLPRGWQWVDPLKDINSSVAAINNGLTSRTRVVSETGGDFEEIAEELKAEQDLIKELDLQLTALGVGGGPTAGDSQAQEEESAQASQEAGNRGTARLRVVAAGDAEMAEA